MIGTVASVIRGEGLASAARRADERIAEALRDAALRGRGMFMKTEETAVLNVLATPMSGRLGGLPAQLSARLIVERTLRCVALLHPGGLEVSAPRLHARRVRGDFEKAIRGALAITGARTVHLEGTDGVPLASALRLVDSGIQLILSVHDFSLFCARPNLLELPAQRFCFYSLDVDRCERCLRQTWAVAKKEQLERRTLGRRLLESAAAVIFPSRFMRDRYRELFSLPGLEGDAIEPGAPAASRDHSAHVAGQAIAYAGSVQRHKGAHLMPEVMRGVDAAAEWHVFGGGDEDLLRAMRRIPNVTVHGYYRQGRLPSLLARHGVGLVVLPSIVPESYGLVLSEAWLAGIPVLAFDLGAPAERIRRDGGGWLTPLEGGAAGLAEIVEQWRSGSIGTAIPRSVPSPLDAARAYVARYRSLGLT